MGRRRCRIENTILFGKYQVSRMIGQGRSGTVYLAVHMGLEEYRAIKRVPKASVEYEQFREEALLLKELRHPGIPIVYDLEEDSEYSYLIEEYLEGDSLYDLVKNHGSFSQEAVVHYGIQICSLVQYLHSAGETPILYLDLQPKNLLLCHQQVKLIDFDHAAGINEANEARQRFGTPGFCAPEQRDASQPLDVETDVFAIGCILHFLLTGCDPGEEAVRPFRHGERQLANIIRTCTDACREARSQSAKEVQTELEETGVFKKSSQSSLVIALIGSKSGVGTTHLSLGLSEYLRHKGYPNLYEEHNQSGAVRQMARCAGANADTYGIFKVKHMMLKPKYGESVRLKKPFYQRTIRDYGSEWDSKSIQAEADLILLVLGGKWWDVEQGNRALEAFADPSGILVLYNHTLPGMRLWPPKGVPACRSIRIPWFASPFAPEPEAGACMGAILEAIRDTGKGGLPSRGFLRSAVRKICRKIGFWV